MSVTFLQPRSAKLSDCGRYRYRLERHVGPGRRVCVFIMLNPSTADAVEDDPTIRRCIGFADTWACGRLIVVNLFAYRATQPEHLQRALDPVGPGNDDEILRAIADAGGELAPIVVCAWGVHGVTMRRDRQVMTLLRGLPGISPMCLGVTKLQRQPKHPLYLAATTPLIPYEA